MSFESIRFWVAVLLLVDAGIGLWNEQRLREIMPRANVRRIALIEAFVAFAILTLHFLVDPR